MASISINCLFYPQTLSSTSKPQRNNNKPPNSASKTLKPRKYSLPNHAKLDNRRISKTQPLNEATTYTRLPPRDDFSDSMSDTFDLFKEVKLSDSDVARFGLEVKLENVSSQEDKEEESDDEFGADSVVDYGKFDIFERNSGSNVDGDDYDTDYEEDVYELDDDGEVANMSASEDNVGDIVDGEDDDVEVKEKGVPAVMRCFDRAKVFVKAGDGGNGVMAMRREKFVPLGGPSGGDGGRGGNVVVEVEGSMNSLLPFRNRVHFRAGRGSHGKGKMQHGAKGENVVVKVAPGTVIREAGKDEVLLELLHPGQRALLLPGGRGGRGNASFKSGSNRVPRIAENGEEGAEMWLDLELKLVADVGIVGAPNAGKSTLLSVISAAQPTIANYPFTTLLPNLGVVSFDYDSTMVVADLPGLLEGAHRGFGLGHEFLRHTERCSALVHVIDGSSPQPDFEFDAVRLELEMFSPEISEKPYIVAFNKMDLPEAYEKWPVFKERLEARGITVFSMSAVKKEGTHEVSCAAYELVRNNKKSNTEIEDWTDSGNLNHIAEKLRKQRNVSINEFEISHDSTARTWHVVGAGLQRFVQMTNWRYVDSEKRFQHVLDACGVNKSLLNRGVKEGDTVIIGEMEMIWHDSPKISSPSDGKKESEDLIKWPQWK